MPLNAVTHVKVDYCLPLEEIAPLLVRLANQAMEEEGAFQVSKEVEIEVNIAKEQKALDAGVLQLGEPSNYACPECHGVLLQMKEGTLFRFRCHTGHAYSIEPAHRHHGEDGRRPLEFYLRVRGGRAVHATCGRALGPRG